MNTAQVKKLIAVGAALEQQVKAAAKLIEELFRVPIKTHLAALPAAERREGLEVQGVKAYIQEDRAKDELQVEVVSQDFKKAVAEGKLTAATLKKLVEDDLIGVANPAQLAGIIAGALGVDEKLYTARKAGGGRPALKFLTTNEGQFAGLEKALAETVDLVGSIRKAAEAELPTQGRVAIR
jgi:hypothetical protein